MNAIVSKFRHNLRYFLFVVKKCCLEKEEGKLSGEIIDKGEILANGLPLLYSVQIHIICAYVGTHTGKIFCTCYSQTCYWGQQEMYVCTPYVHIILIRYIS